MKFEKVESLQSSNGQLTNRYYLKALETGLGITIGNTLRRVLLTQLSGTAISGVRVYGTNHEYGTIPGIREDVLEILLNLKQIKIQGKVSQPCFGTVEVNGPKLVTARNIILPEDLRIINLNHYVGTVSDTAMLKLDLRLESGKGYALSSDTNQIRDEGFFEIDAIFTPVINVSFNVKDLYRFENQALEDLELIISTDGTITPDQALIDAAQNLKDLFGSLVVCEPKMVLNSGSETLRQTLIEDLQLSVRAYNCLKRVNIRTINDLKRYSLKELREIKNFGEKCENEVTSKLRDRFDIILN